VSAWGTVRLRRIVHATGGSWGAEPDDGDVVAACVRGTDFDMTRLRANLQTAPMRGFAHEEFKRRCLERGDLIIEKSGGGDYQPVGRVVLFDGDQPAVPTNFAARLRPGVDTEPRFLCYVMASLYSDGWTRSAIKQTTGIQNLDLDALLNEPVPIPGFLRQRAIADFLDAETARVDALIAKKRRLKVVLLERRARQLELAIRELVASTGETRLKLIVDDVTVGIVVTPAAWYTDAGVPALRGINVRPGEINMRDLVHISAEGHILHSKSALRSGDVVVVRTGDAGAAAVVPPSLNGSNCIDLLIIRPGSRLDPKFLELVLNSDWVRSHVRENSVGTIQSHFNVAALKELPIPCPSLRKQAATVERLNEDFLRISSILDRLTSQIDLLTERRQVLITAAVTGELHISGAA
jgi:type I restriction enzyme, S subunit